MIKLILTLFIVISFNFISNLNASDMVRIDNPKVNGIALDWCKTWGINCGKPAADYYCQYKGFKEAVSFEKDEDIGYTKILKTGKICNANFCDSFKFIICKRHEKFPKYKRFIKPKYDGVALDWCYTWGSSCGSKVATEYCKFRGYNKGFLRFEKEEDVGYTKIMRTGQICNNRGCDSFKYIDCKI